MDSFPNKTYLQIGSKVETINLILQSEFYGYDFKFQGNNHGYNGAFCRY